MTFLRPLQVHHVQILGPQPFPVRGHSRRVVIEDRLAFIIPLIQPNAPASPASQSQGESPFAPLTFSTRDTKLASIFSPTSPLFSGWNCDANRLPRPDRGR